MEVEMDKVRTILVGAGGYGANYVKSLLEEPICNKLDFVAVIDPYASKSPVYDYFNGKLPIYDSLEDFFKTGNAELTIISTPIHLHYDQCITAMKNGSHVLCEKPLVPTLEEHTKLVEAEDATGRKISVGFQWCYSEVILELKRRILSGELGAPNKLKTLVSWPRKWEYFTRTSGWAGKMRTSSGKAVHDSVLSNATAHYIQNILFVLGANMEESAELKDISAKCYRANDIETFDTIFLEGQAAGAKVVYVASHGVNYHINPVMDFAFEHARVLVNVHKDDYNLWIHYKDGRVENLGAAMGNSEVNKLMYMADYINGTRPWVCSTKTVRPFTVLLDTIFTAADFRNFPESDIVRDHKDEATYVPGLHLELMRIFNS